MWRKAARFLPQLHHCKSHSNYTESTSLSTASGDAEVLLNSGFVLISPCSFADVEDEWLEVYMVVMEAPPPLILSLISL